MNYVKALLLILLLIACEGPNSVPESESFCAEARFVEEGFWIQSGEYEDELIPTQPDDAIISKIYIIRFLVTDSEFHLESFEVAIFDQNKGIINKC